MNKVKLSSLEMNFLLSLSRLSSLEMSFLLSLSRLSSLEMNFLLFLSRLSSLEMNFLLFLSCLSSFTQNVFVLTFLLPQTSHVRPFGHCPTFHCSVPGYTVQCSFYVMPHIVCLYIARSVGSSSERMLSWCHYP